MVARKGQVARQKYVSEMVGNPTSHARTCVDCGATKTPQWREGPAGPKTLCNACGVRLNRQNKLLQYEDERLPHLPEPETVLAPPARQDSAAVVAVTATKTSPRKRAPSVHQKGFVYGDEHEEVKALASKRAPSAHQKVFVYGDELEVVKAPASKRQRASPLDDSEASDYGGEEVAWPPEAPEEVDAVMGLLAMAGTTPDVGDEDVKTMEEQAAVRHPQASSGDSLKEEAASYGLDIDALPAATAQMLQMRWQVSRQLRLEAALAAQGVAAAAQILAEKQAAAMVPTAAAAAHARLMQQLYFEQLANLSPRMPGSVRPPALPQPVEEPQVVTVPRRRRTGWAARMAL